MGVCVDRNPVGAQQDHVIEGPLEGLWRLQGEAIDQIQVDGLVSDLSRGVHERLHLKPRLYPMNGDLYLWVEVLHAKGQPIEAKAMQVLEAKVRDGAGINLNRVLPARHQLKVSLEHGHHITQFSVTQERWGSSSQVKLAHLLALAQVLRDEVDLSREIVKVFRALAVMFGDELVAGAVVANRLAEGDVDIDRECSGGTGLSSIGECIAQVFWPERLNEAVCGRVGGVARTRNVVALE